MKIQAFSKTYDGVTVLSFPGMELKPGKIYAVIGANGSGKSTFAKVIAGVLPADRENGAAWGYRRRNEQPVSDPGGPGGAHRLPECGRAADKTG